MYMWPRKEHVMYSVHTSHSMNMLYTLCKSTAILSAKNIVQCCIDIHAQVDCTCLYHCTTPMEHVATTFPVEPIVAALCNELSKSIRLTYFLKKLPARIKRLAYLLQT